MMDSFRIDLAGKAGGLVWKLAMTLSGFGLTLLGSLAVWSFWIRRVIHRRSRRPHPASPARSEAVA